MLDGQCALHVSFVLDASLSSAISISICDHSKVVVNSGDKSWRGQRLQRETSAKWNVSWRVWQHAPLLACWPVSCDDDMNWELLLCVRRVFLYHAGHIAAARIVCEWSINHYLTFAVALAAEERSTRNPVEFSRPALSHCSQWRMHACIAGTVGGAKICCVCCRVRKPKRVCSRAARAAVASVT